jgi:CO/xanthine dehydrogenase FAD-binding subunit
LKTFQYHVPNSLEEACQLLFEFGSRGKLLAGGTDLLVKMKQKVLEPEHLISIGGIKGLKYIQDDKSAIRIGALTELQEIADSGIIRQKAPILADAASKVGSLQIRNRGTLGGNICNASPAADTVPPLLCLDAKVVVRGNSGKREIPLEKFFLGPGKVDLQPGEIVTEIVVPEPPSGTKGVYLKLGRRKGMDLSVVGVASLGRFRGDRFEMIRISLASVAPTAIRTTRAEHILMDGPVDPHRIVLGASEAASECQPISDVRGSEKYRKEMVRVLVEKAIRSVM